MSADDYINGIILGTIWFLFTNMNISYQTYVISQRIRALEEKEGK